MNNSPKEIRDALTEITQDLMIGDKAAFKILLLQKLGDISTGLSYLNARMNRGDDYNE